MNGSAPGHARGGVVSESAAEQIIVRCPNWLGDVVMTTPGLRALRRGFPEARIVAQLPEPLAPLLAGTGLVDEVWPVASRTARIRGGAVDVGRLRAERFDLGLVVPESISSALLMRAGGVRRVVGFARDGIRRRLLHHAVPAPAEWGRRRLVPKERFVLALVEALGVAGGDTRLELAVTPAEEARLEARLADHGSSLASLRAQPPIVLAPGASFGDSKCWPAESYAGLGDALLSEGHRVIVLGAPGESERVRAVSRAMGGQPVILDAVLDLGALKALLRQAAALVANDAGARHVAAALGTPSVIFFGPTSVAKTAENLDRIVVLEREVSCRPCYRRRCPIDHRCLTSIDVRAAREATRAALALGGLPASREVCG